MASLTPHSRNAEATAAAMEEGLLSGAITLLPSSGLVYYLTHHVPRFAARTNMQSRTALAIMPALFMFAFTAETRLTHKMHEIARETEHSHASVRWAEEQLEKQQQKQSSSSSSSSQLQQQHSTGAKGSPLVDPEAQLLRLYQQSVENSGVQIVPGDSLTLYQRTANFVAANPLKVVLGCAIPSVAWIFYGRTGKEHLQLSMKLLHTRVFGQFATLSGTCMMIFSTRLDDSLDKHECLCLFCLATIE